VAGAFTPLTPTTICCAHTARLNQQTQILAQELAALTKADGMATTLCAILESPEHQYKGRFPTFFFPQLARLVKLSTVEEALIALAATQSGKEDVASCARTFAKSKLSEVLAQADAGLPERIVQQLVMVVLSGTAVALGISTDQCDTYVSSAPLAIPLKMLQLHSAHQLCAAQHKA
jgi:hypothetical protein